MNRIKYAAAAALLCGAAPARAAAAPLNTAKINAVVAAALQEFNVPGAMLEIDVPGTRYIKAFGVANYATQRPAKPGDSFAIRSITKSFVVTEVLQLIAASNGAVTLDDPIGDYLPNIPNGALITLRELANMTSGLYNYTASPEFQKQFGEAPTRQWSTDELLHFALYSKVDPIVFPPGTQYQYSNTNTLLLGKLVEVLAGRPFAGTLTTMILRPVGLPHTVFLDGVALPRPAATGYQGFFDSQPEPAVINASSLGFAGAMAATIADLAKWGNVLAVGNLLPKALQAQRFIAHPTAGDPASPLYDSYGLGMGEVAGWWGHTGSGVGFEAAVLHQIARNENFAILLNASNAHDVPVTIFCRIKPYISAASAADTTSSTVCSKPPPN